MRFSSEWIRIGSNYLRLGLGFMCGLWLVRLLIALDQSAYAVIVLLSTGLGIQFLLREWVGAGLAPVLAGTWHSGNRGRFVKMLSAAQGVCAALAILTALGYFALGFALGPFDIPPELRHAAVVFIGIKAVQGGVLLLLAPTLTLYVAQGRIAEHNFWILAERSCEVLVAAVLLTLHHDAPEKAIIGFALGTAIFQNGLNIAAAVRLWVTNPETRPRPILFRRHTAAEVGRAMIAHSSIFLSAVFYVRADLVLLNLMAGLHANLIFGIANQVAAYLRMLTFGLASGLEAVGAKLSSTAPKGKSARSKALAGPLRRILRTQAFLVCPAFVVVFVLAEPLLTVWIGDRLDDPEGTIPVLASVLRLLTFGTAARGLTEGWLRFLGGAGEQTRYAGFVRRSAFVNPVLVVIGLWFSSPVVAVYVPCVIFVGLMIYCYVYRLPQEVAEVAGVSVRKLWSPILIPAAGSVFAAPMLLGISDPKPLPLLIRLVAFGLCYCLTTGLVLSSRALIWPSGRNASLPHRQSSLADRGERMWSRFRLGKHLPRFVIEGLARFTAWFANRSERSTVEARVRGGLLAPHFRAIRLRIGRNTQLDRLVRISLGDGVTLGTGCRVITGSSGRITIERDTVLGRDCLLQGQSGLLIGSEVRIGSRCRIHAFPVDSHSRTGRVGASRVEIESGCQLGAGSVVLPGTTLRAETKICRGTVATGDSSNDPSGEAA